MGLETFLGMIMIGLMLSTVVIPKIKNLDRDLVFTNGSAITADGYSEALDFGDVLGAKGPKTRLVIIVTAVAGTNPTMDITLRSGASANPTTTIATVPQITGVGEYGIDVPDTISRYARLHYDIGGTDNPSFTIKSYLRPYQP